MDIRDLDRRAGAVLGEVVMQVRPEHLWFPDPLPGLDRPWSAPPHRQRERGVRRGGAERVGAGADLERRPARGQPAGAYRRSNVRVADAFADGGALDRLMEVRESGSFPRRIALTFHQLDCVVHAWDLARAIDAPYDPPQDLVELAFALARRIPDTDATRGPGAAFERSVKTPGNASDLDQLLGSSAATPTGFPRSTE